MNDRLGIIALTLAVLFAIWGWWQPGWAAVGIIAVGAAYLYLTHRRRISERSG